MKKWLMMVTAIFATVMLVGWSEASKDYFKRGESAFNSKNYTEAVKWYRKAAEQGYAEAQYIYGRCCLDGTGIAKNPSEGVKWLLKAAEQGNVNAMYDAGVCYCDGIGVKRNIDMALKYFVLAEKAGHPKCKNKAYEEKLTAATLEENGLNFNF